VRQIPDGLPCAEWPHPTWQRGAAGLSSEITRHMAQVTHN
jgi:hypothetical protein